VHVGAGVRVADRFVVAAATRKMTDHLSDVLFTTDSQASQTLGEEGLPPERVHCVGNLAVDSIRYVVSRLRSPFRPYFQNHYGYALVVLSDPANMAGREPLVQLTDMLAEVSRVIPIVWLLRSGLHGQLKKYHLVGSLPNDRVHRAPAQPYVEYVALLHGATCVLTDSWTVQEEATALRVPCLVIGVFPERPLAGGSNISVGLSRTRAVSAVWEYVLSGISTGRAPALWDGRTGARIAGYLAAWTPATTALAATPSAS
jgi:UDP-N-acetylglucosamine 2-epimerase (non-hydrolysing)